MEQIEVGLDPDKAKAGLEELQKSFKDTAVTADRALGRDANESMVKFEQAAEKGTNNVKKFFGEMGKKIKDDIKTAFNVTGILEGTKFVNEMQSGIRSTLEMERAFSRLQVRLGLTNQQFAQLKTNMGARIAATGQGLESVLPGVDVAAARGGIKDPNQLSAVAEQLAKARGVTGEETGEISEAVVEILKAQGKAITAASFKETLDALEGTRKSGAFQTAGEAGRAVEGLAPYAQRVGLGTREMGGLAAAASRSGSSGQDILQKLLSRGTEIGGAEQINAALGVQLFKGGKLDPTAFKNIKQDRFGQYSQQLMGEISGMTGASGGDLKRFVDSMKTGMADFSAVVQGTNETAMQFDQASDNFATKLDKFKERMKNATREIGSGLSDAANSLINGHGGEALSGLGRSAKGAWDNKGTLAAGGALTAAAGLLMGGSLNALLKKVPGGGLLRGAAEGAVAKEMGAQPVYVVNFSEFGAGGLPGLGAAASGGMLSKLWPALAGAGTTVAAGGGAAAAGFGASKIFEYLAGGGLEMDLDAFRTNQNGVKPGQRSMFEEDPKPSDHAGMKQEIVRGIIEAHEAVAEKLRAPLSNPSHPNPLQGGRR